MGAVTAAVVGGAIMAGGSYMASREARKGAQAQIDAAERAAAAFRGIRIPTIEEQSIILQNPDLVGEYTPEQIQLMQEMTQSAMEGVQVDTNVLNKQKDALEGISDVAEGGYSESDKATAREIQRTVSQDAQARQKAILNAMASRGVLGSGMELAAQLQGNQQAAEQMSRGGEGLTQQAQARALQALGQQADLASQMRTQEYGEQTDLARARDAINQFNVQNRQRVAETNLGERNRAQLLNLQQKQSLEDQRAALSNQQQMYNKQLLQTQFANKMGKESQVQQANMAVAQAQAQAANAKAAGIQGIAQGVGTALGGVGSYYQGQQDHQNALALKKAPKG
jgi:hypothetical protein